jgi:hypothetical protein
LPRAIEESVSVYDRAGRKAVSLEQRSQFRFGFVCRKQMRPRERRTALQPCVASRSVDAPQAALCLCVLLEPRQPRSARNAECTESFSATCGPFFRPFAWGTWTGPAGALRRYGYRTGFFSINNSLNLYVTRKIDLLCETFSQIFSEVYDLDGNRKNEVQRQK